MTQAQGYHLIGVAWLILAVVDQPHDIGTALSALAGLIFLAQGLFGEWK